MNGERRASPPVAPPATRAPRDAGTIVGVVANIPPDIGSAFGAIVPRAPSLVAILPPPSTAGFEPIAGTMHTVGSGSFITAIGRFSLQAVFPTGGGCGPR